MYKIITAPATAISTVADMKDRLKVDVSTDDDLIASLIETATKIIEEQKGLALITQTLEMALDDWPKAAIDIHKGPVQSITSITYVINDVVTTWAASNYILDDYRKIARIGLARAASYPGVDSIINTIKVRFVAGYGVAADVPEPILDAAALIIGNLYENREDVITVPNVRVYAMPYRATWLLNPYRLWAV